MSFEWKHPNYYKELKKIRESESKKELENNEDKEMSEESQDPLDIYNRIDTHHYQFDC